MQLRTVSTARRTASDFERLCRRRLRLCLSLGLEPPQSHAAAPALAGPSFLLWFMKLCWLLAARGTTGGAGVSLQVRCSVVWCQRDDDSRQSRAVRFADWSEHRTEILIDSSIPRFHCCSTHSLSAQDAHKKYAAKTTTKDHGLLFRNRCLLFRRTICRRLRRRTGASAMWTGSNTSSSL